MRVLYDEITDQLLGDEQTAALCPEGMELMPLCIGRLQGQTADCFFSGIGENEKEERLLIAAKAVIRNGTVAEMEYSTLDNISISIQQDENPEAQRKYAELYPTIREIAFSDRLTSQQRMMLEDFMNAWNRAIDSESKKYMRLYFPEFYEWEEQIRKEGV